MVCCCSMLLAVAFVVAIVALLLIYSGLLHKVEVKVGVPYLLNKPLKIFYKFGRGPYKHTHPFFSELTNIVPEAALIGIYYDDPSIVRATNCRWVVGAIAEIDGTPVLEKNVVTSLKLARYKEFTLPAVQKAIVTNHPYTTALSIFIALNKVYKKIRAFSQETTIVGSPGVEIYKDGNIYYTMPVEKNELFMIEEAKQLFQ